MAAPEVLPELSVAESLFRIQFDKHDRGMRKAPACGPYGSLSHTGDGIGDRNFYYSDLDGPEGEHTAWEITEYQGSLLVSRLVGFGEATHKQPATAQDLIEAIDLIPKVQPPRRPLHKRAFSLILQWGPQADIAWLRY